MAKVGEQLKQPEAGWKRYDDKVSSIHYFLGTPNSYGSPYMGGYTCLNKNNSKASFLFFGTKIRIISLMYSGWDTNIGIKIDGIEETFSEHSNSTIDQAIVYEKTGLKNTLHKVDVYRIDAYSGNKQIAIDAIDIDDNGQLLHPDEVSSISQLKIGKRIRCHYKAVSNTYGTFSGLGKETSDFISPTTSSATPNGDFYFICVDKDHLGRWKLIADRNIQHSISWDTLNSGGVASGSGLPVLLDKDCLTTIRLIEGGIGIGKDYEWDEYIVNSNLKGLISAGDNRVWNFKDMNSWTSSSWHDYSEMRTVRGASLSYENPKDTRSVVGFRPVLLLAVKYIRNIFFHNNNYKTYNNGWKPISTTLPSKDTFMSDGMRDLSVLDRQEQTVSLPMTSSSLGEGRVFKTRIDYKKYFALNNIDVK